MSFSRTLRFIGEIAVFGLGVLFLGIGILGAVISIGLWGSQGQMAPGRLRVFTWCALGALAFGGVLLLLYRRYCRPSPREAALPPSVGRSDPPSGVVGALRRLIGGALAMGAFGCLLYGVVGGIILMGSLLGGQPYRPAGDIDLLRAAPWCLPLGFILLWAAYLVGTDRGELERQLETERRQYLLAVAQALQGQAYGGSAPVKDGNFKFGWRGVAARLASGWAAVAFLGFQLRAWDLDGSGLRRAGEITAVLWLGSLYFVLAHEWGHLLGGWAAGVRADGARVGRGPLLWRGTLVGVDLRVHAWPSDGCAYLTHRTERHFRARTFAMYAGGPAAHALAVAAVFWAARGLPPAAATFLNLLGFVGGHHLLLGSLLPFRLNRGPAEYVFLDAAALLNAFRLPGAHVRWRVGVDLGRVACKRAFAASAEEQRAGAAELAALFVQYPESGFLHLMAALAAQHREDWAQTAGHWTRFVDAEREAGSLPPEVQAWARNERTVALAMAGDHAAARAETLSFLGSNAVLRAKVEHLDRLACLPLMRELRAYTAEALDWTERGLTLDPASATLRGTRGSLLVELGRLAEGTEILRGVRAASASPVDQGLGAFYLALAARQEGRDEEARALAAEAFRLYPGHAWMKLRWETA